MQEFRPSPDSQTMRNNSGCGPMVLGVIMVWVCIVTSTMTAVNAIDANHWNEYWIFLFPIFVTLLVMGIAIFEGATRFAVGMILGLVGGVALMYLALLAICGGDFRIP